MKPFQEDGNSWIYVSPGARIRVFFLEPDESSCVGILREDFDYSRVMQRSELFNSNQGDVLYK